jgi:HPr kinase/phosphorylase
MRHELASFLVRSKTPCSRLMQIHASCVSRDGAGVLLLGPSGCGKSDLALQLLECGFVLVADDRVDIEDGIAMAPAALAGLLEVRGLGILRLPHAGHARLALAVNLGPVADRLPEPSRHPALGLPMVSVDPGAASAAIRIRRALDCAQGRIDQHTGAFTA